MKKFLFIIASSFTLLSCDYVSSPVQTGNSGGPGPNDTLPKRVVLLEEATGHTCTNCPSAAATIQTLKSTYGEQLVPIAIHYGWFAEPCPPHPLPNGAPSGSFSEDLRCPEGSDYDVLYSIFNAPPAAMVNRLGYPADHIKSQGQWAGLIDSLVNTQPLAALDINHTYDTTTRALSISVDGQFLQAASGDFNLVVMLVEDGIIGWQVDGSNYIPNYEFNHVLRACVNTPGSIAGEQVATGTIAAFTSFNWTLSGSYTVSNLINHHNCNLVVFLYNFNTKEAIQAGEVHLIP